MRRRYIAVKIEGNQTPDEREFHDAVWTSILRLFGEYGASQTGLFIVECNPERKQAILRCSHRSLDSVRASLVAITEIGNESATVHILSVSGTLKALRKKMQS